ncbi:MAG: hypothetical protein WC691_08505 [Sulfuricurvum sp.]|jgi:hypothetical protein
MDTLDLPIEELPLRKRYIVVTIGLILMTVWAIAHIILFTPLGNWVLSPLLQNKLTSALQHPITLKTFTLTSDNFEFSFVDEANNSVNTKGIYTLIPPHINALYDANLSKLAGINTTKLPIEANGTLQGAYHDLHLTGETHLFSGSIDTNATLHFLSLSSLQLQVHNLPYQPFMETFDYPHTSDTILNGNVNISGIDKRDIIATGQLMTTTHHFKPSPLKEDNESFDFWSLLADKEGKIHPFILHTDLNISVDELGIFEQFTHYPLRTKAKIHSILRGTQNHLKLNTTAFAAGGKIDATLNLSKLRPKMVNLTLKHADALSLFKLISLPAPITGNIDGQLNSDFTNTTIALNIKKGHTLPSVLKRHYKITQPLIAFNSSIKVTLKPKSIHYSGTFKSDLEDIRFDGSPTHDQMLDNLLRQISHTKDKGEI